MKQESPRLQKYLRRVFKNDALRVVPHAKKKEMAEIFMGDEFLATLYRDEEDGEISYQFQMAILAEDLDEA
jgi:hypothetical protein